MALTKEDKLYLKELLEESGYTPQRASSSSSSKKRHLSIPKSIKDIHESKVAEGIREALFYSNPATALMAENWDLVKALGGLGLDIFKLGTKPLGKGASALFKKLLAKKNKKAQPSSVSKLLPMKKAFDKKDIDTSAQKVFITNSTNYISTKYVVLKGGTNYIAAKQAIFKGGKNYINVTLPKGGTKGGMGVAGLFKAPKATNLLADTTSKLLPTTKEATPVIEMKKGIDGIYKSTKEASKILGLLNKKAILIGAGVLLGVSALIGLASWLRIKIKELNPKNIIDTKKNAMQNQLDTTAQSVSALSLNQKTQADRLAIQGNTGITDFAETKKTKGDTLATEFRSKAYSFKGKAQETKILAPWEGRLESASVGDSGLTFVGTFKRGLRGGRFAIIGIGEPYIAPGEKFKKGQLLGTSLTDSFKIVANMSSEQAKDYMNLVNEQAKDSYAQPLETLRNTETKKGAKRAKYYDKLLKQTTRSNALDEKFIYNPLEKILHLNDNVSQSVPPSTSIKTDNVNLANKNEQLANNNIKDTTKKVEQPKTEATTGSIQVAQTPPTQSNLVFGISDRMDVQLATSNILGLNC